jgi:glycerophosphoryl diester phosphodiesterase
VEEGAQGVELDVRICASGEVVVCHDRTLQRLAGVGWEIALTPWWKLRRADVGTRLGFAPARIPLLEDVLAFLTAPMLVNVELKSETADDAGLVARTVEVIRAARAEERVVISSFQPLCLLRAAALAPRIRRGYLLDPDRSFAIHGLLLGPPLSSFSVHPHYTEITAPRVRRWKGAGVRVAAWTVDEAEEARRLEALGVDYLITNRPAFIRDALRSRGRA